MSDRLADLFVDDQLTPAFRRNNLWRVVKVELQWQLLRLRQWWELRSVRNDTWESIAEEVLEIPDADKWTDQQDSDLMRMQDYLSHDEVERHRLMPPRPR